MTDLDLAELERLAKKKCPYCGYEFSVSHLSPAETKRRKYCSVSCAQGAKRNDHTGEKFNRLTFIRPDGRTPRGEVLWLLQCDCGGNTHALARDITNGFTQSCGCFRNERINDHNRTHGLRGHPLYSTWISMKDRCLNPNNHAFHNYGGRGITVCDEWVHDFAAFVAHVGEKPTAQHSIDRIDNDGNYEPGNVRWATFIEQANNTRRTKRKAV